MSSVEPDVERFLGSALIPIRNTDRVKYPLTPSRLKDYYLDLAASEFLAARRTIEAQGLSLQEQAHLFRNPSRITRMSYYLLEGSRRLGHGAEHQHELLGYLLALVAELKHSDPYGEDRLNQQHAPALAMAAARARGLAPVDRAGARRFHRLAALLRTYMDAVYLVPHDVGMEMYGPYDVDDSRGLVRSFFNLRAADLWPETARIPASEIIMDAAYSPSLEVSFDLFNNPYMSAGSYTDACRQAAVQVDGEAASPARVESLTQDVMEVVRSVVRTMASLPEVERAGLYIRCFWRRMARFLEAAGRSPTPPAEVAERLRSQPTLPPAGAAPTLDNLRANLGI